MATAIIGGLLSASFPASNITVSEPWDQGRATLARQFPSITITTSNSTAISSPPVDLIILAVKPQVLKAVAAEIAPSVQTHKPTVVSIAAGITLPDLNTWLGGNANLVRVMPNTPALVGEGAAGMFAAEGVTEEGKEFAGAVMASVSKKAYWVANEALLDVVTGVSGSGPAYFFLMVEALANAGEALGLPKDVAQGLAAQTCLGAGRMLVNTAEDPAELRRKVTSPAGTTHAAIVSLEESGMRKAFEDAVKAATDRGAEMGKEFGGAN